jgi:hypothetical protein
MCIFKRDTQKIKVKNVYNKKQSDMLKASYL